MPVQRIHLVIDADVGPALWAREQTAPGRSRALPELGPIAERLGADLPAGPLRHRVVLRRERGGQAVRVPAQPLDGPTLLKVLGAVRDAVSARADDGDAVAAIGALLADRRPLQLEEDLAVMPDLLAGVLRDVQAERIVARREVRPVVEERFGQAWARWSPLETGTTPLLEALVDARARRAFASTLTAPAPSDPHDLLAGLARAGAPLRADVPALRRVQRAIDDYLASGRPTLALTSRDGAQLVVRLFEPAPDGAQSDQAAVWPLQTCLREADGTVHPVAHLRAVGDMTAAGAAEAAGEVLRHAPGLRGAAVADSGVDWELSTWQASRFLTEDAPALEEAGVAVMLPRTWTKQTPTLRVSAEEDGTGQERRATGGVGLQAMASFRWAIAVGDTELTEEEIAEIREAQSELVQLRGQWIRLDASTMRAAERFLERFATGARRRVRLVPSAQRAAGREEPAIPGVPDGEVALEPAAATWTAFFASVVSPEADGVRIDAAALGAQEKAASDAERNTMLRLLPGGAGPVPGRSPSSLRATLRPYQQQGLDWMWALQELGMGGILADDMGLGKTMQVLALLCRDREQAKQNDQGAGVGPTLLVCPMSVVGAWQREAARWAPELRVHVHHGGDRVRDESFAHGAQDLDLILTTYSLLDRDLPVLRQVAWRRVVFDEAQHIKTPGTATTRAARALPAPHRLALTGTPVENRLRDLHALMEAVNPGLLGSADGFQERIAEPIEQEGDEAALSRLRLVTSPFILRRLKTDRSIIADLPEKTEETRSVSLTPEQAGLYEALVGELMAQIDGADDAQRRTLVGAALTRLKQVCNHPAHYLGDGSPILGEDGEHRSGKLELVDDILSTAFARGEKVLLFTQFTTFGHMLVPYWRDAFGLDVPFLHGGVTKRERDAMVAAFQGSPDRPGAMLLSLRAGGTGLTLTAANHVVHLDRWWNPAVENQATDRAFRIGQTKDVQVRKLVAAGTIEERIDAVLTEKSDLAQMAVAASRGGSAAAASGESWLAGLDDDALRDLLRLDREEVGA